MYISVTTRHNAVFFNIIIWGYAMNNFKYLTIFSFLTVGLVFADNPGEDMTSAPVAAPAQEAVVETIDQSKCRKIIISSEYYLSQHNNYRSYQCRYDVIAITGELDKPVIEWIKNAFQA